MPQNNEFKTAVIVNPNSGNGTTGKKIGLLKNLLKEIGNYEIKLTQRQNHATEIARESIHNGFNRIIAIGGDGTINEIVNGFFENSKQINSEVILGVIPYGTGSDFVKSISLPRSEKDIIKKIINCNIKTIDIGKSTFHLTNKTEKTRMFINVSNIGLGGEVVNRVNKTTKMFGGFASFLIGTIATVMEYKNKPVFISFDDNFKIQETVSNIVIGNGKFCGGGMKFLPDAELDDGLFDVLTIGDITKQDFFMQIPKVYSGTHLNNPKLNIRKAKKVFIDCPDKLRVDLDGEQEGYTAVNFEVIPKALKLIV